MKFMYMIPRNNRKGVSELAAGISLDHVSVVGCSAMQNPRKVIDVKQYHSTRCLSEASIIYHPSRLP